MPQNVGRYAIKLGVPAQALKNPDDADEMAVADLGGKDVWVLVLAAGLAQQQFEGRLTYGSGSVRISVCEAWSVSPTIG